MPTSPGTGAIKRNIRGGRPKGKTTHVRGSTRPGVNSPGVVLPLLRTSERSTFKRCRWKWYLEFHEQIKPMIDVPPLRFGGLLHEALGIYYKPGIRRGPHPALTFEQLYEEDLTDAAGQTKNYSKPEIDQIWSEHRDLGYDMLGAYIDKYGKDEEWKVLVTEYAFRTIVNHPVRIHEPWFYYTGILDGVWENRLTGKKVIPDHKSTKSIQLQYLRMDPQATAYWTFGVDALIANGLLAPNGSEKLDGMLFNFLRKAKRDERPRDADGFYRNKPAKADYAKALKLSRGFNPKWKLEQMNEYADKAGIQVFGEISKSQPSPYHARVTVLRGWAEREGLKQTVLAEFRDIERVHEEAIHSVDGLPEAYKNAGQFTCPGCWALDMCELHEIQQDWMELRDMTTRSWEPYSAHEIKEGR